ncbi:MAG: WYL domain-containing protein [Clostridia bacterium]|nr:WYL domain-containing protein [Clostridia bacterium]
MAKGKNSLKILYILDILKENSKLHGSYEPGRFINANKIIDKLREISVKSGNSEELTADRKSVYTYIRSLMTYGYNIETDKRGYYLIGKKADPDSEADFSDSNSKFQLAELRLIADALNASRFIPANKADSIIKKLVETKDCEGEDLGDLNDLRNRHIFQGNPFRSENNSVIYNIDNIHRAINSDRKISFRYMHTVITENESGNGLTDIPKINDDGSDKLYVMDPIALVWKNEYYYVLCYDKENQKPKTFRVDRMKDVFELEDERRDCQQYYSDFDIAKYSNTAFSMFGGENRQVTLRVKKDLASVIADRFGFDTNVLRDSDESFFLCDVVVQISDQFYSWLSGFKNNITLAGPDDVREDYISYLKQLVGFYEETI